MAVHIRELAGAGDRRVRPCVQGRVRGRRGFFGLVGGAGLFACGSPRRPPAPRASAPRLPETRETIEALIAAWREKSPVVGLSMALVCDGELAWAGGYGAADHEAGLAASESTVYAIGSLTKPYVALTALRAAAAGQLDLDAPIRVHLPALRSGGAMADAITARQLLCHRSGLPSEWHRNGMAVAPPPWTEIVDEIRDEPLIAPPGSWTAYSNVGYTLLAHALTRATGRPFEALLAETMGALGPATPNFGDPAALAAYAQKHRLVEPRLRHAPAAGLHASVLDVVPLLRFLVADSPLAAAMLSPQRAGPLDFDEVWGLGLAMRPVGLDYAGRAGFHVGRTACHRSALGVLPDHGLAVVVLANSREASGVEELAIVALQTALLERHGIDLPASPGDAELPATITAEPAALRVHAGRYVGDNDIVELAAEGGALVSRSEGGEVLSLVPAVDGCFTSSGGGEARLRVRAVAGRHVITSRVRAVERRVAVRCLEGHVPEVWWRRLGRYRVVGAADELLAFRTAALERQGDSLCLRFDASSPGGPSVARQVLGALDGYEARIDGIGRGKGQRVGADDRGGGELQWAGYRMVREA